MDRQVGRRPARRATPVSVPGTPAEVGSRPVIEVVAALVTGPDGRTLLVRKRGTAAFMNPGGKPEAGEPRVEALRRELHEEIGLDVPATALHPLGTLTTTAANEPGHDLVAHCFLLHLDDAAHVVRAEIEESRWVDPAHPDVPLAPLAAQHLLPLLVAGGPEVHRPRKRSI